MTATATHEGAFIPVVEVPESFWDKTKGVGSKITTPIVNTAKSGWHKLTRFSDNHPTLTDTMKGAAIMFYWTFVTVFVTVFALLAALITADLIAVGLGL